MNIKYKTIAEKIEIGKEASKEILKHQFRYRAWREIAIKHEITEMMAYQCYEIYLAYMRGKEENGK